MKLVQPIRSSLARLVFRALLRQDKASFAMARREVQLCDRLVFWSLVSTSKVHLAETLGDACFGVGASNVIRGW